VMEFAVIHHGKPAMGICRGCQVVNAYFGGTIKDVPFQGRQELIEYTDDPLGKRLRKKGGREIIGYSAHGQAADKMGEGLRVILMKRGIVKAFMNQEGTVIGTQFHPERYIEGKMVKEKMGKADLKQLITILGSGFINKGNHFFETGPVLTEGDAPQLNRAGEEAIIKFCNQLLVRMVESVKVLDSNQIFFKLFLERVRANRGGSTLQPSGSSRGG
jgi:GMP synthase-like glutamine amidotransferase